MVGKHPVNLFAVAVGLPAKVDAESRAFLVKLDGWMDYIIICWPATRLQVSYLIELDAYSFCIILHFE